MFFTFDHLLCPAHKAEHSRSVRTGQVAHGGDGAREADVRMDSAGDGDGDGNAAAARGRKVRRALSTAVGPAMPFTHTTAVFATDMRSKDPPRAEPSASVCR